MTTRAFPILGSMADTTLVTGVSVVACRCRVSDTVS